MDIKVIKSIISELNNSNIIYFEYKNNSEYLKIAKKEKKTLESYNSPYDEVACTKQQTTEYKIISEYVGIVILFNNKILKPFVSLGEFIKKGDRLCIIKHLNISIDIKSNSDGFISKICVSNKTFVDYGKVLFIITKDRK